ncbi:MAG: pseudouridine synthase [Anaerolineae bacterium]
MKDRIRRRRSGRGATGPRPHPPGLEGRKEAPSQGRHRYILFYKPYGVLSHFTDAEGRPTLAAYIPIPEVYAAGRLDLRSEGLLLLTDDGVLLHRVTHPRYKLPKTYWVQVEGVPSPEALEALRQGVWVKGEQTGPADVEVLDPPPALPPRSVPIREREDIPTTWLQIVLREGKKRQVRHMTAAVGHPTLRLVRVALGPLTLTDLEPGQWRDLTPAELRALREALRLSPLGRPRQVRRQPDRASRPRGPWPSPR